MATYKSIKFPKMPLIPIFKVKESPNITFPTEDQYSSGESNNAPPGSVPDENGFYWVLPNGQPLPEINAMLYSDDARTYYFEEREMKTRFQTIGKTLEQCSRARGEFIGLFTGEYFFKDIVLNKFLTALQVRTVFPFDRKGNPIETEYTLWVNTYVKYEDIKQGIPAPGIGGTDNENIPEAEQKSKSNILIIGLIGLALLSTK